jgi:hypothetical protein
MAIDETGREIIQDCLSRIQAGDPDAAMDLAREFWGRLDQKDIGLNLAVIEALATIAKQQGSAEAAEFLEKQWPEIQWISFRRLKKYGFTGEYEGDDPRGAD